MEEGTDLPWDRKTLLSRIADTHKQIRYEAGSPDPTEIARYRALLGACCGPDAPPRRIVVLGMTPELRRMALATGAEVLTLDSNPEAIALYRSWVPEPDRERESIVQGDWFAIERLIDGRVDGVLGDGVFGNILTIEAHERLLRTLRCIINPGGRIILRQALIPRDFPLDEHEAGALVARFRHGQLTPAEFGFGMRLWGSFTQAYRHATFLLDNRVVFERYRDWLEQGRLTPEEFGLIRRYYFGGMNVILPQEVWEALLGRCDLRFEVQPLAGRAWYAYYPIYGCDAAEHRPEGCAS